MSNIRIPRKIAGIRIPKEVRKAGARLPKSAGAVAAAAIASAFVAGTVAVLKARRTDSIVG